MPTPRDLLIALCAFLVGIIVGAWLVTGDWQLEEPPINREALME